MTTTWKLAEGDEIAPGRHALRLLGGGRRHEAYLAWDEALHAPVVAKLLRPAAVDDAAARAALAAEGELLRALAHPLLVRAFDTRLAGPRPHLVLEYVEGPRLSTLIRRYGLSLEQLLPLGLDVARVLRFLAAAGVVHLDVKPGNVVMDGRPRLIDLSVARRLVDLGRLTAPVGTDAYMAPEQCDVARFGRLGPATDVWGLGATLYEGLAGNPPFRAGRGALPAAAASARAARAPGAAAPGRARARLPGAATRRSGRRSTRPSGSCRRSSTTSRHRGSAASGPAARAACGRWEQHERSLTDGSRAAHGGAGRWLGKRFRR